MNISPIILTSSGRYFNFEDPESSKFDIVDIAHALSHICRFTGHCNNFYSVAQHSVLVSTIVPFYTALEGLLHDAHEAFVGDVAKPLKILLPDYELIEKTVQKAVLARFGITDELPKSVKYADRVLLRTEQRDLMNADSHDWILTRDVYPLELKIIPLPPPEAKQIFIDRYQEIMKSR